MELTYDKDIVIIALAAVLSISLWVCVLLFSRLKKEKYRSRTPLLSLHAQLDPYNAGLYLQNLGDVPAKEIILNDFDVVTETNIGGAVTLKFSVIPLLAAHAQLKLEFKIFNGNFPISNISAENIIPHLAGTLIEARLAYQNLNNIRFEAMIRKEKNSNTFNLQQVKALN